MLLPNPAHALGGGIAACFHAACLQPAASNVQRWAPASP